MFVATPVEDDTVIAGFYSLHLGSLERQRCSLAAALGQALLRDALVRTLLIASNAGAKIFLVHAKDETAKSFYLRLGFEASPVDELTLMLLVQDLPGA